jgi:hypothetical protein
MQCRVHNQIIMRYLVPLDLEVFYAAEIVLYIHRREHASIDDEIVLKHKYMCKMDSKIVQKDDIVS